MPLGAFRLNSLSRISAAPPAYLGPRIDNATLAGTVSYAGTSKFGTNSLSTTATNNRIYTVRVNPKLSTWYFNTSNTWTIEFWVNVFSRGTEATRTIFALNTTLGSGSLTIRDTVANGTWQLNFNNSGTYLGDAFPSPGSTTENQWYHIAIVSNGTGNIRYFANGVQNFSGSVSITGTDAVNNRVFTFGHNSSQSSTIYFDEIRVSDNARYTANFTPPTAAFVEDNNTLGLFHLNDNVNDDSPVTWQATGGIMSAQTIGGTTYKIHRFTTTGANTFTVNSSRNVDILLVGGGSSGVRTSSNSGGGGGAGGLLRRNYNVAVTPQAYTITVGAGGTASSSQGVSNAGGTSSGLGFSAAGGLATSPSFTFGLAAQQGRSNGDFAGGIMTNNWASGASGAGAGGAGNNATSNSQTNGGVGAADSDFTATQTYYGGGGGSGAASATGTAGGLGGIGGGGNGGRDSTATAGVAGTVNTGGGGGGGAQNVNGGAGGSGIVIIRYPI